MFFWAWYPTLFFKQLALVISYKPTTSFPTTSANFWQQTVLVMSNPTETAFNLRCLSILLNKLKANKRELFPTNFLSGRGKHLNFILNWRAMFVRAAVHASHNDSFKWNKKSNMATVCPSQSLKWVNLASSAQGLEDDMW